MKKIYFSIIWVIVLMAMNTTVFAAATPTAFLYDGKELVFQPNNVAATGKTVTASWSNFNNGYSVNGSTSTGGATLSSSSVPWYDYRTSIESVTIQDGVLVSTDTKYWFYGFTKLSSLYLGNGVTNIGEAAFYNASSLKSVTIPACVGQIGLYAFHGSGLTSVTIQGTNSWVPSYPLTEDFGNIGDHFNDPIEITKASQLNSSSAGTTGGSSFSVYTRDAVEPPVVDEGCSHTWVDATCTQPKTCSLCGETSGSALGHDYGSTYQTNETQHWKKCSRCTSTSETGNHTDTNSNGYCDTCNYAMDIAPTKPTITVKDANGNIITSTWTNKDLKITVDGSTISNGKGSVGYKYKMNNGSYSEYSSAASYTSINTDTTFYAKAYNKDSTSKESAVASRVLPKIEKTAPTFTLTMDSTDWAKKHIATLKFADTGGSGLKGDTYKVEYAWTTSTTAPSTYTGSITVNVNAGENNKEVTLSKDNGTGEYYLHIRLNKNLTDMAGNTATSKTAYVECLLDNTAPVISLKNTIENTVALNSSSTYTLGLLVTEKHSGINTSTFEASDIKIKINGTESVAQKELTYKSLSNGVYEYSLKISNVRETGPIVLEVSKNSFEDNAHNGIVSEVFELTKKSGSDYTGVYADNIAPVIMMMGEITDVKVDAGKNLNNYIDKRYANKYYTISIPFQLADVGGQPLSTRLDSAMFSVNVGGIVVTPTISISNGEVIKSEDNTGLTRYQQNYTLTLYALLNDGYLELTVPAGTISDFAGNINTLNKSTPYTKHNGKNVVLYVDNTLPQPTVKIGSAVGVASSNAIISLEIFIKELGSGITSEQFKLDDMKFKIDGASINDVITTLVANPNNNYNSNLGSDVITNYTYTLKLSNVKENGILRIQITDAKIVDKANNGNSSVTMDVDVIIDNEGPKIGVLTSNANEHGEVYGEAIEVKITGCFDPSGIAQYEWQRSFDGLNFETIFTDDSIESESTVVDSHSVEMTYHYRVIVKDKLGNSTTSHVLPIIYKNSLNTKPTIILSKNQIAYGISEIHGIIKSKSPISKIIINGDEFPKNKYQNNVVVKNYEITTTFDYQATSNGIYTVEAIDQKGNHVIETININTIDTTESIISYTKHDATLILPAQIIFTSNEPVRIINANEHPGITYDTTNFSNRIVATVSADVTFDTSKIFTFENKGLMDIPVEVLPPLITKFLYIRFSQPVSTNLNMSIEQIESLIENMATAKVFTETGQIISYYGLKDENVKMKISTQEDIRATEQLGATLETYYIGENGERVKLEKSIETSVLDNSNYANSNESGTYRRTQGLLDNYSDTLLNDLNQKHERFRITIVP